MLYGGCGWYHVLLDKELEYFAPGFHDYADLDSQGAKLVLSVATTSIPGLYNSQILIY